MPNPKEYQEQSSQKIYDQLKEIADGKHPRYLLADEVGLGKTIVAQDVIRRFHEGLPKKQTKLNVIYFSCNLEIADQNISKLYPQIETKKKLKVEDKNKENKKLKTVDRLTLFPFEYSEANIINILSFTPGTSLSMGSNTSYEREIIFKLFAMYFRDHKAMKGESRLPRFKSECVFPEKLRRLLQGNAPSYWGHNYESIRESADRLATKRESDPSILDTFIFMEKPSKFIKDLFQKFDEELYPLLQELYTGDIKVKRVCIYNAVKIICDEMYCEHDKTISKISESNKYNKLRNKLIGKVREIIARVAISSINPDLIIMDEFQKFDKLLYAPVDGVEDDSQKKKEKNILVDELLTKRCFPCLLLSATPFKVVGGDEADNYKNFKKMLSMLVGCNENENLLIDSFEKFRKSLSLASSNIDPSCTKLLKNFVKTKINLEKEMTKYMSRTERFTFMSDNDISLEPIVLSNCDTKQLFNSKHFEEYFKLEKDRIKKCKDGKTKSLSIEFWKTGQGLKYHCKGYAWHIDIYGKNPQITKTKEKAYNPKIEYLIEKLKGTSKCLWTLPSSRALSEIDVRNPFHIKPMKFLIFSSWKFVPRMIREVVNDEYRSKGEKIYKRKGMNLAKLLIPYKLKDRCIDEKFKDELTEIISDSLKNETQEETIDTYVKKIYSDLNTINNNPNLPGNAIYNAIHRYFYSRAVYEFNIDSVEVREKLDRMALTISINTFRRFFLNPVRFKVITDSISGTKDDFEKLLKYLDFGYFGEVIDELIFLQGKESFDKNIDKSIKVITNFIEDSMNLYDGAQSIARNFNETASGKKKDHKMKVRKAFNSPFYPFVLASTSVGQEGLDFHHYCQDIIHWDIPGSPDDFEQREGRIQRYLGRSVRVALIKDYIQIERIDPNKEIINWNTALKTVNCLSFISKKKNKSYDYFANGLYPEWIYSSEDSKIRRHVMCFPFSKDIHKLNNLMEKIKLFRFAMGQSHPDDAIEDAKNLKQLYFKDDDDNKMKCLSINLKPFDKDIFNDFIRKQIKSFFDTDNALLIEDRFKGLLEFALNTLHKNEVEIIKYKNKKTFKRMNELCSYLSERIPKKDTECDFALWEFIFYLASPYDQTNDNVFEIGIKDDVDEFLALSDSGTNWLVG